MEQNTEKIQTQIYMETWQTQRALQIKGKGSKCSKMVLGKLISIWKNINLLNSTHNNNFHIYLNTKFVKYIAKLFGRKKPSVY